MAHAHTPHEADCSSLARRYSGALLLLAIASLLVACGGAGEPAPGGSGGGGGTIACTTGAAPTVLAWDAVTGAAGYRIYYGTASGTYPLSQDAVTNPYTVTGLSPGTTYYFVATAYDSSNPPNVSSFSNAVCKSIS